MPVSAIQISSDEWDGLLAQLTSITQIVAALAQRTTKVEELTVALNAKLDRGASETLNALQEMRLDLGKLTDRVLVTERQISEHTQELTLVETRLSATELEIDAIQETMNKEVATIHTELETSVTELASVDASLSERLTKLEGPPA